MNLDEEVTAKDFLVVHQEGQPYARHILDAIAKIRHIEARGDLTQDDVLYDAVIDKELGPLEACIRAMFSEGSNDT